jgi:lysylphosphatidylglycerol synthetase-like protein (DUF2156 family)
MWSKFLQFWEHKATRSASLVVFYVVFLGLWIGHTFRLSHWLRHEWKIEHGSLSFFAGEYVRLLLFTTLFFGLLFWYLLKRREMAWLITVILMGGILFYTLFGDRNYIAGALAAIELAVLLLNARYFRVRNVGFHLERRLTAIVVSVFAYLLILDAGFGIFASKVRGSVDALDVTTQYWAGIVDPENQVLYTSVLQPHTAAAWWFVQAVSWGGGAVIINILLSLLVGKARNQYPVGWADMVSDTEIALAAQDTDNLATLKIVQNLEKFELDGHRLYCLEMADALVVLGDPIFAAPNSQSSVRFLTEFTRYAHNQGKIPFFFQSSATSQSRLSDAGFVSVPMGQDALVRLSTFDLSLPQFKDVRYAYNKLVRDEVTVKIIPFGQLDENVEKEIDIFLHSIHEDKTGLTARFSLSYWRVQHHIAGFVAVAYSPTGIDALMSFLPYNGGLLLDMLVRNPISKPGVTDGLMASALLYFKEKKYTEVNLGVAFTNDEKNNRIVKRFVSLLPVKYSFSGITKFKQKFYPEWQPRFISIPGVDTAPIVARTLSHIFLGKER